MADEMIFDDDDCKDTFDEPLPMSRMAVHWKSKSVLVIGALEQKLFDLLIHSFSTEISHEKAISNGQISNLAEIIIVGHVSHPINIIRTLRLQKNFAFTPIIVIRQENWSSESLMEVGATVITDTQSTNLMAQCQALLWSTHVLSIERSHIEMSPAPIVVLNDLGELVTMNDAAHRLLDTTEQDAAKTDILLQIKTGPHLEPIFPEKLAILAKENGAFECVFVSQNKKMIPLEVSVNSIVLKEGLLYSLLLRDLTIEKEMEAERERHSIKAIHTEKMMLMGEMVSYVAHEINNPLSVIQARIALLQDSIAEHAQELSKDFRDNLVKKTESIEKSATRIQRIVRSLYRFSRNEAEETSKQTSIEALISATLDLCSARFANHGVALEIEPYESQVTLCCRDLQVSQILLNLLNNAFDAIKENEKITPNERWVKIGARNLESTVEFFIANGGPKIPDEVAAKVFDPYFTTKSVGKGTGLGLSISRSLAVGHGGRLYIEANNPNTCFVCCLPKN